MGKGGPITTTRQQDQLLPPRWVVVAEFVLLAGLVECLGDGLFCGFEIALGLSDS